MIHILTTGGTIEGLDYVDGKGVTQSNVTIQGFLEKANVDFEPIPGTLPQPGSILIGCRFRDRCSKANKQCEINPPWQGHNHQHQVRCWHPKI